MNKLTSKLITEFIGTMFLVLTAMCSSGPLAPLAIGGVLMAMIYMGGDISGAHYNPAVSLGLLVRGKLSMNDMIMYWVAQFAGAALAAVVAKVLVGHGGEGNASIDITKSLIAEFLFTFALASVVLNVATNKKQAGNNYYGLAIGFLVMAGAVAVGGISGGAFNPAVAVGASIFGAFSWANIWVYLVACFAGGAVAGIMHRVKNPDEYVDA